MSGNTDVAVRALTIGCGPRDLPGARLFHSMEHFALRDRSLRANPRSGTAPGVEVDVPDAAQGRSQTPPGGGASRVPEAAWRTGGA